MKFKYVLIYTIIFNVNAALAQLSTVKGKVTDSKTNAPLSGVTVKTSTQATKTNSNGYFELIASSKDFTESGVNLSRVGYLNTRLLYKPKHFYEVGLAEIETQLNEVTITPGDDILKKAIKKIPENYPNKAILIKGVLRMQNWRNQSEYFKSDALIKAYIPPYNGTEKIDVMVLQNHLDTVTDKSLRHIPHRHFYQINDFAHNKSFLNKFLTTKKFEYRLVGKQLYNNHKVFVINISLADTAKMFNKMEATFYIDTASYAFVAANITYYNWQRMGGVLGGPLSNTRVAYEKMGNKWYLAEAHHNQTNTYKNEAPRTTVDFIRTEIDTINVAKLAYKDIVQGTDDALGIDKLGTKEEWAKNETYFKRAEEEEKMTKIPNTLLDTIKQNNVIANQNYEDKFSRKLYRYLTNNNVRTSFALYKLPFVIKSDLFAIAESTNYGYGYGMNFRVYKSLFLGLDANSNFWNKNKINLATLAFNVANEFVFKQNARKITLTPFVVYQFNTLKYQKTKASLSGINYGLNASFELSHKKALFISYGLNSAKGVSNFNGLNITPRGYMLGFGLIFR